MLSENHRKEAVSLAAIDLLAAEAGLGVDKPNRDMGVDGTFREIRSRRERRLRAGLGLDFQAKSTERIGVSAQGYRYDLDAKTHDYLLERSQNETNPIILLVVFLQRLDGRSVWNGKTRLLVRSGVFWVDPLVLPMAVGRSSRRIHIPAENVLTPERLLDLMRRLNTIGG